MRVRRVLGATFLMLLIATGVGAYAKYDGVDGEFIASGDKMRMRLWSKDLVKFEAKPEFLAACGFEQARDLNVNGLLLPAVQRSADGGRDYRVRTQFTLNFEHIDDKGTKVIDRQRIRARARGSMSCSPPDGKGGITCVGSYAVRGRGGKTSIRGTVHQEFTGFYIDDIIIGVNPDTMSWDLMGACRTR